MLYTGAASCVRAQMGLGKGRERDRQDRTVYANVMLVNVTPCTKFPSLPLNRTSSTGPAAKISEGIISGPAVAMWT